MTIYTIEGRPLSLLDLTNDGAAFAARLSGAVIDEIALLEITGLPVSADKIAQRTASALNRHRQNAPNCLRQFFITFSPDAACRCCRMNAGLEQTLGGINISYANHNVSSKQHLFDRRRAAACSEIQHLCQKDIIQRFHTQGLQLGMMRKFALFVCMPQYRAETAGSGQSHYLFICEHKIEMVMFLRR